MKRVHCRRSDGPNGSGRRWGGLDVLNNLSGRWRALVAGAAVMLVMGPGSALAQSTRGSVAGTVRDGQGAAVPGATVELTSPRRNDTQVATANESGDFVFLNLSLIHI